MSEKLIFKSLSPDLEPLTAEILQIVPVNVPDGTVVNISRCNAGFSVKKTTDGVLLQYDGKPDFFRALTFVSQVVKTGDPVTQTSAFSTLCYMADASRNAVPNLPCVKKLIRLLASMGYNALMLYTEDTYEVPDYPYFGHMRGRYTVAELKELDDYADSFGIELIPCIQTLAHLSSALRWDCFRPYSDTPDILLAGDERTYSFVEAMIKTLSSTLRTRRIHLGMDEAHSLGLGKYLDRNGYRNRFEILSAHLQRVMSICDHYGLQPMIWSDMFFRLGNHGSYYLSEGSISKDIYSMVPENVSLVYWDYYSTDVKTVDCMFENHKGFPGRKVFAGGAWKWSGFAPHNRLSDRACDVHVSACLRHCWDDVIVTGWGDDGGEASQFSILPCLSMYAERCYDLQMEATELDSRFEATFGVPRSAFLALDLPNEIDSQLTQQHTNPCKYLLYNGVLNGLFDAHVPADAPRKYLEHAKTLLSYADIPSFGYIFASLAALCHVLEKKCDLSVGIRKAYEANQKDVLRWYAEKEIPEILSRLDDFIILFRQQWYHENKTFGFDVQEIRLGGLKECLHSAAIRLRSYCSGEVDRIEELEQPILPFRTDAEDKPKASLEYNIWEKTVSASKFGS